MSVSEKKIQHLDKKTGLNQKEFDLESNSLTKIGLKVRRFPYPFKAMLSICSDLDETPIRHVYFEIMRFLNTSYETSMGKGVGLEVGNTIYFDMPKNQFSYWNTDENGRAMIRELIHSGHIDCLHSFGDLATTRKHAAQALEELDKYNCKLKVWVDHGTAPSNLDGDIMKGQGDLPESAVYHSDLTMDYGIRYAWRGRVTSIVGQNVRRSLGGIWRNSHPYLSANTIAKEFTKGILAALGSKKYEMHRDNNVLRSIRLRDGRQAYEFMRCNPHWGGVSSCETAAGAASVISRSFLDRLIERKAFCILYTHLGKKLTPEGLFPKETIKAFNMLANYYQDGRILVTTTQRLLDYQRVKSEAKVEMIQSEEYVTINIKYAGSTKELGGLCFISQLPLKLKLLHNGKPINFCYEKSSIGKKECNYYIKWSQLGFPVN